MHRRYFMLTSLVGIFTVPMSGGAQQPKQARIGYLSSNSQSDTQDAIDVFARKCVSSATSTNGIYPSGSAIRPRLA